MEKHYRIDSRLLDSLSREEQTKIYKRYTADAIVEDQAFSWLDDDFDAIFRVSTTKQTYQENGLYPGQIDFGVDIEVFKPKTSKRYPKSKEEILMELKILIMTYINDLSRDFISALYVNALNDPLESVNTWGKIEKFIDDTFYEDK